MYKYSHGFYNINSKSTSRYEAIVEFQGDRFFAILMINGYRLL